MLRVTCCLLLLASLASGDSKHATVVDEMNIEALQGPLRYLMVRPSDQITVNISAHLLDVEVSEADNKVTLGGWMTLQWIDHRLAWSGGAAIQTRVSQNQIWTPDLSLYNRVPVTAVWVSSTPAVVYQSGRVLYVPPVSFTVRCQRNLTDDRDRVSCPFRLGSWTHNVEEMDLILTSDTLDTSDFFSNGRWVVESTSLVRKVKTYPCCPEEYVRIEGEVVLKPQRS